MGDFTAYIDESGAFGGNGQLGRRSVVAVVLPRNRASCDDVVTPALVEAAGPFGLPFHATDCLKPVRFRRRLRERGHLDLLPESLRTCKLRPGSGAFYRVCAIGGDVLNYARKRLASFVADHDGFLVCDLEYDRPAEPGDIWQRMVLGVAEQVGYTLALRANGAHRLDWVVGQSGHVRALSIDAFLGKVRLASDVTANAADCARADDVHGLQVADVFAHALGPRGTEATEWTPKSAANVSLRGLRGVVDVWAPGAGRRLDVSGALPPTHGELTAVATSRLRVGPTIANLERQFRRPPPCTFRASVEGTADLLRRLS